jgi:Cyclin
MSLYCFFHAWYSMVNSYALTDVLDSEPNPNSVPRPEGLELSFNMTRKLSVMASKLNKCLKKYEKNVTVNELYPEFEWVRPSIRISGMEGSYIASFLNQIIAYNNACISKKGFINLKEYIIDTFMTDFTSDVVNDLIESMIEYFKVSDSCVILLFIYMWRLDNIILHSKNWKHILITIMMVVVKWNEDWDWSSVASDKHLNNKEWATFGQIDILYLNNLELDICKKIGWRFFVTKNQFKMAKALIHMKYFET